MASLPYPLDRLDNHDRVNGVPKLKQMRAESPMSSTAQGNALGCGGRWAFSPLFIKKKAQGFRPGLFFFF